MGQWSQVPRAPAGYFPAMTDCNQELWAQQTPSPLSWYGQSVLAKQQQKKQRCLCSFHLSFLITRIAECLPCQQAQV